MNSSAPQPLESATAPRDQLAALLKAAADPFVGKVRDMADAAAGAAGGLFERITRRDNGPAR